MEFKDLKELDIPDVPGVYYFRGTRGRILYIGKATSLQDRVRSYFSSDLAIARSQAVAAMVSEARTISWQKTDSVLEALILEANLIKKYQPLYNSRDKDDKSFNYLVITKEDFPRVLIIRGRELYGSSLAPRSYKLAAIYGPFPQGGALKEALKIVRKIFPFRDKCAPNSGKPCFNRQIGLCPGVCGGEISELEYAKTIRNITKLFSGNMQGLKRQLEREMRQESKAEHFEKAGEIRRQVSALNHIRDVSLIKNEDAISAGGQNNPRVEAYDVAHTSGTETVGAMVVVVNGEPIKAAYRKFKIKSAKNDDVASLAEILSRRLAHTEWPLPRIIVVDGGVAQLRVALRVLKDAGVSIPVVGVVKNDRHKPERLIGDAQAIKTREKDILLASAESHRFAIKFHRVRRQDGMIGS